jgi:OPA family glycerol-3-phosphate transporter-like MFS transporter
MKGQNEKKAFNSTTLLIALCWIVYTCSYLGKLGYNANITQIEKAYSISHSTAGMVSTFFFFAYGIGQIINGIFCKKYNVRLVVFGSLLISGLMNLLVGFSKDFTFIKYFWLINGAALSVLWSSLIRLLSEALDKANIGRAVVVMGTTVATGTFFVYGLSALFVALGAYEVMFFLAGILLPLIALLWIFSYSKLVKQKTEEAASEIQLQTELNHKKKRGWLWIPICILAVFAVFNNLVKDGLTTWVPMILKETYALPDYVSILLTMLLPILAIFGTSIAVWLQKKFKDFVMLCSLLFLGSGVCIGLVILCMPTGWFVITLISLGIVSCLMAGVNNIVTSMVPLYWKEKFNAGLMAGVLNGCCYVGSTLSAYGLGLIADMGGWNAVFWLLFSLCVVAVGISVFYGVMSLVRRKINERMA